MKKILPILLLTLGKLSGCIKWAPHRESPSDLNMFAEASWWQSFVDKELRACVQKRFAFLDARIPVFRRASYSQRAEMITSLDCGMQTKSPIERIDDLAKFPHLKEFSFVADRMALNLEKIAEVAPKLSVVSVISFIERPTALWLAPLQKLTRLAHLRLVGVPYREIADISKVLHNLTRLTYKSPSPHKLGFCGNLSAFSGFTCLSSLSIEQCNITDLHGLKELENLTNLAIINSKSTTPGPFWVAIPSLRYSFYQNNSFNIIDRFHSLDRVELLPESQPRDDDDHGGEISTVRPETLSLDEDSWEKHHMEILAGFEKARQCAARESPKKEIEIY